MILKCALVFLTALPLGACYRMPEPSPRAPLVIGQTQSGQDIYRFRITRSNALGIAPVSNSAIAQRGSEICPGGYEELSRTGDVTRRSSGVIYTDVDVTLICT